jgi:adenylate kinase family enzyme
MLWAAHNPTRRVIVLGCSGSGKSTLARQLALEFELPFHPTDDIYWTRDWRPVPTASVREWLERTTSGDTWVLDGNFD